MILQEAPPAPNLDTKKLFGVLTRAWKSDRHVLASSDPYAVLANDAYQLIIAMGTKVLPLIFEDYQEEIDHWAPALDAIVGSHPIKEEHCGRPALIREDWLAWGRENGYLQ